MNKADSERIRALLDGWGLEAADDIEAADVIVLNSCVVRQKAENRVLSKIGSLAALKRQRPERSIIVTGCLVDGQGKRLRCDYPQVDAFFKPGQLEEMATWMLSRSVAARRAMPGVVADNRRHVEGSAASPDCRTVTAFIPIIQGCDNFCSYCIVPYRRGREKSRPLPDIVGEAAELAGRGVKEITLVGQNVDSYGHDLVAREAGGLAVPPPDRNPPWLAPTARADAGWSPDLADLLQELNGIDGLWRLRFLTSHPKDMTPKLIKLIPKLEKVCEHINLPVQAGSDRILELMGRGYTVAQYRDLIAAIRREIPGVALSTDVIVGFPGETEDDFRETYSLLEGLRFDTVHVAAYSPRAGTLAARTMNDDVPAAIKNQRLQDIEQLQEKIAAEINAGLVGQTAEVLVERRTGRRWMGRTRTNKLVFFEGPDGLGGRMVVARITRASAWSAVAEATPSP